MPTSVDPKLLEAFGIVLRDSRKARGFSSIEKLLKAAARAGLAVPNSTHVSDVESGRVEPGLAVIFKLARANGVRMSELLRKVEDMRLPPNERERIDRISAERTLVGSDTCRVCKRVYTVYAVRTPTRKRGQFRCLGCKQQIASWNATTQFIYETKLLPKTKRAK